MSIDQPVLVERKDAVLILTLNRPHAGNAVDLALAKALFGAAVEADEDDGVRCVVLTGKGRFFCAGGDVASFTAAGADPSGVIKGLTAYFHAALTRLSRMNKPLLTAVNGPAAGAGFGLALLGDIALASPTASFWPAYPALGLTPDAGLTWLLPRLVGLRHAQEIALTNRRIDAAEAAAIGLVTRVVDEDAFQAQTYETATVLARNATSAFGATRTLLLSSFETPFETQLEREAHAIAAAARSPHGIEGVAAFLQKREPDFS